MRLIDLEPQFRTFIKQDGKVFLGKPQTLAEAQGITFDCPRCKSGHWIGIWFADKGAPEEAEPLPRWKVSGTGYDDLTVSPSVDAGPDCWHGFITNGEIVGGLP